MKQWIKRWWFSIICWLVMAFVIWLGFYFIYEDDELLIIFACFNSYLITAILFSIIGLASVPPKEEKKYQHYKDFLEWFEEQKEKEKNNE